jgi:uroporphyrinogen decarboxylase
MNQRERFKRTMRFQPVDRVPFWDYGYWEENLEVWQNEGLPPLVTNIEEFFGIETWTNAPVNIGLWPPFKEEVLEENDRSRVIRDQAGQLKRESKVGSSIPQFIEFPVKNRAGWEKIRAERFDPDSPERFPDDWADSVKILNAGERPVCLGIDGYYGHLRNLFGLETLSVMFYDDPALILDIQEHMTQLRLRVFERALKDVKFDAAMAWEDMACNKGPLVSPAMYKKFMLPFYKRITSFLAGHGIDIVIVDSDGNVNELVPCFIESGVTGLLPFEVRAGNDVVEVRKKYPTFGIVGGIDKMALLRGKKAIDGELDRMKSLLPLGGFIPTVDHRVPPDVPLANYVYYLETKWHIIHDSRNYRR